MGDQTRNMINRKSTNLDIGLQSSSSVEGHLTSLMHHFHLPHHKVQLKKERLWRQPVGRPESDTQWKAMMAEQSKQPLGLMHGVVLEQQGSEQLILMGNQSTAG